MVLVCVLEFVLAKLPIRGVEFLETCISPNLSVNHCLVHAIRKRERQPKNLGPADDEYLRVFIDDPQGIFECVHHSHALAPEVAIPGQYHVSSIREGIADGLERPPTHDRRVARRERFETLQVFREVPRKYAAYPNDSVLRDRDY